jgi:glucan-binding YG repeat protein
LETVVMLIESGTSIDPNAFSNCSSSLTIWCNNPSTAYTYATTQATPRIAVGLLLTGMTIEDSLSLNVGASATLSTPSYLPADEKTETPAVTWTSSDQTKATVDATGKVTAVASGTTDITAEAISLSGEIITSSTCVVTVSPAPSGSITSFTLSDGETVFAGDIASNNTIAVEVPYITNVTALIPAIEVSEGTVEPESGTPADFTNPVVFTTNSTTYTVTVTRAPATKDITSFTLEGVAGTITDTDASTGTIDVTLPAGTNVTALEPVIEHDGASIDISSPQNFTTPVTYTVTGADTLTKAYTVTVTVPLSSAKEITTFTLMDVDGVFDGNIITVTLPYGTSVAGLTPVIDHTSTKSEDPLVLTGSLASNNARYTVTAEDGTTRVYTVIVKFASPSSEADIISLKIGSVVGIINGTDIRVTLPTGTSVTALEPEIEISENATVSPDTGEAQNFTTPVIYTVTAQSGAKQNYTVTVTVTSPPVSTTYVVTVTNGSGSASYEEGATVTITANAPAEGKIFDTWTTSDVTLTDANSSTTTFVMPDHAVAVTATYKDAAEPETYAVTVTNGTGSGNYAEGATVSISANAAPSGKTFDTWTGDVTFANANSASTSFVMPNHAVTVTATYKDATPPTDDNWAYEDGTWYLVDDGGQKLTGWQKVEDTWYYLASSGEMQTGWEHVGSSWYYLAGNGKMQTGWVYIGGKWYYLTTSGAMKTGWQKDKNAWYYLAGNGAMVTAKWLKDTDGSWYYLAGSGKMLTGKQAIGGKAYTFKANGVWVS